MAIAAAVESITAERARALLGASIGLNRPYSRQWAGQLAGAIVRGEWKLNGESIKLDEDGNVLDGQHRLNAMILAADMGFSGGVPMLVTTGLSCEVFDTLDQGKRRNAADVLSIKGEKNAVSLASVLRNIRYVTGTPVGDSTTTQQIEALLAQYPTARYWSAAFAGCKNLRRIMPSGFMAVFTVGAIKHGTDTANVLLEQLETGIGLEAGSPALILRQRMIEARASPIQLRQATALALMVKTWNAHVLGKKIGSLRFGADESFPMLR